MKKTYFLLTILAINLFYSCSSGSSNGGINEIEPSPIVFDWTVPIGTVLGSFNLFPLAENPILTKASDVTFITGNSKVAMIGIGNEIRVYPYRFISTFECVNDKIGVNNFALTYCPITQSAISWDTNFRGQTFTLRSSGYLHHDNLIAYDSKSESYWSQMLSKSIKGQYSNESISTFNVIETTWSTVEKYFPNAMVFTNTSIPSNKTNSISNKTSGTNDIIDGENIYGIVDTSFKDETEISIFKYEEFAGSIKIFEKFIDTKKIIIVGNQENTFITSYINDSDATFTPIQNSLPIMMEDSNGNTWDMFGNAISGPRKGVQLKSPNGFVALGWAWKAFYQKFVFNN